MEENFGFVGGIFFIIFFALNIMLLHKFENDLNIISELMDFEWSFLTTTRTILQNCKSSDLQNDFQEKSTYLGGGGALNFLHWLYKVALNWNQHILSNVSLQKIWSWN